MMRLEESVAGSMLANEPVSTEALDDETPTEAVDAAVVEVPYLVLERVGGATGRVGNGGKTNVAVLKSIAFNISSRAGLMFAAYR